MSSTVFKTIFKLVSVAKKKKKRNIHRGFVGLYLLSESGCFDVYYEQIWLHTN